jgi:hypothetical protein
MSSAVTRDVIFHQIKIGGDFSRQRIQQYLPSLFPVHRVSFMISPIANRARCRWLFTVPSGIPNIALVTSPSFDQLREAKPDKCCGVYLANRDARAALTCLECGACTDWPDKPFETGQSV